jgi:hypothetical protein
MFDRHDQKLIVFVFIAVFVSYCPQFWGFGGFTWPMTLGTCLRGMTKNSSFLCFRAIFVSYFPLFWGSMEIYKEYDSLYILERNDKKLVIFVCMAIFVSAHSFGVPG